MNNSVCESTFGNVKRGRLISALIMVSSIGLSAGCTTQPLKDLRFSNDAVEQQLVTPAKVNQSADRLLASGQNRAIGRSVSQPDKLVARDLVDALMQIEQFHPSRVNIRLPGDRSAFDKTLRESLVAFGYTIERVNTNSGRGVLLNTVLKEGTTEQGNRYTFILAIDRIAMKRSYVMRGNFVAPVSSLYVRGIDPASIKLRDEKFYETKRTAVRRG
jgi:hypothetical protein